MDISGHILKQTPPAGIVKERQRVSNACDRCKAKKLRCTGRQPCDLCSKLGLQCHFRQPSTRGRKKTTSSSTQSTLAGSRAVSRDAHIVSRIENDALTTEEDVQVTEALQATRVRTAADGGETSLSVSPEPFESDRQGHFVGPASGLSFLLRLQRRLRRSVNVPPETSIFTLGDAPLPEFDELSFVLPPKPEAINLVNRYFDLASATYRFLHRATVEGWLEQLYEFGKIEEEASRSKHAVVLTVFAQASRYVTSQDGAALSTGVEYFQAAERQLNKETEPAHLTSIQAILGECFYILTCSRLNHCWSLFGTASRLIVALGLHRKSVRIDNLINHVEAECKKRVFWVAYNLDKYLSSIMGRPSVFHDEDIDQNMPSLVDDKDLFVDSINPSRSDSWCTMLAPVFHIKLVRIVSRTLQKLYGIKPLQNRVRYQIMKELDVEVQSWKRELPAFLNPDLVDPRLLKSLFQRQSNMLSLAYGHAEILIHRPCLFNDFKQKSRCSNPESEIEANVRRCLTGAMTIATVLDRMVESNQFYPTSWFTHYQTFCAVVVFYTYTIRVRSEDESTWIEYFRAAERCQSLISSIAVPDSLAHRFCVIMEEYRLEVINQLHLQPSHVIPAMISDGVRSDLALIQPTSDSNDGAALWTGGLYDTEYSSIEMDLPNLEQLGSLALDFSGMYYGLDICD